MVSLTALVHGGFSESQTRRSRKQAGGWNGSKAARTGAPYSRGNRKLHRRIDNETKGKATPACLLTRKQWVTLDGHRKHNCISGGKNRKFRVLFSTDIHPRRSEWGAHHQQKKSPFTLLFWVMDAACAR